VSLHDDRVWFAAFICEGDSVVKYYISGDDAIFFTGQGDPLSLGRIFQYLGEVSCDHVLHLIF